MISLGTSNDVRFDSLGIGTDASGTTGELCLNAMNLSKKILQDDGVFISKLFMGSVFKEINETAKKSFKKVVIFKPLSSKKESKEIYIFCKGLLKM